MTETRSGKLELTCVGKENRPQLEPRVLVEDPTLRRSGRRGLCRQDQVYCSRRRARRNRAGQRPVPPFDRLLCSGTNLCRCE